MANDVLFLFPVVLTGTYRTQFVAYLGDFLEVRFYKMCSKRYLSKQLEVTLVSVHYCKTIDCGK